jgi:hypothetical protein
VVLDCGADKTELNEAVERLEESKFGESRFVCSVFSRRNNGLRASTCNCAGVTRRPQFRPLTVRMLFSVWMR